MTQKQNAAIEQLRAYLTEAGLEILEEKEIDHARQFKISNGIDTCPINVYTSGKITTGGKQSPLKQQMEEWKNLQQAQVYPTLAPKDNLAAQNRAAKFIVAQAKIDTIKALIEQLPAEVTWRETDSSVAQLYQAEVKSSNDKVVITQYRTGMLMVQGRATRLFDEICDQLDRKLSQPPAERAARYIPEASRQAALSQMNQPEADTQGLTWLVEKLGREAYEFLYPHDQETLLSGAMLLQTAQSIDLKLPDYSVLVMPFARAYEGFLVKLFIHIGLAEPEKIEKNVKSIQVGSWLNELPELIVDTRHCHLGDDLKTAWTGSRHLLMHSDYVRQTRMATFDKAYNEICGVIIRAFERGFENFIKQPIELDLTKRKKTIPEQSDQTLQKREVRLEDFDEEWLLSRLETAGYKIERIEKSKSPIKWRVMGENWQLFCHREPKKMLIVRGEGQEEFLTWLHSEEQARVQAIDSSWPAFESHIGADEAGKGDYFGPLVVAAVYVTAETGLDLIKLGIRDSKNISDSVVAELALEIRERCPSEVHILMPLEYNAAYQRHQNLNRLLAEAHAKVTQALVERTGCRRVVADQFADPQVLEKAVQQQGLVLELEQRTKGEADVAVAAASILARESFVAAIEDFRSKAGMDIPLGASSPKVVEVGQAIVRRWGQAALERIAKVNFKTTEQILKHR